MTESPVQSGPIRHSADISALLGALAAAQSELTDPVRATKSAKNRYADLHAVLEAARVPLSKQGLAVIQAVGADTTIDSDDNTWLSLTTMLGHKSGQWLSSEARIPMNPGRSRQGQMMMNPAQAVGSAVTYLRRYTLAALLGLSQKDDDGEGAGAAPVKPQVVSDGKWTLGEDMQLSESGSWATPMARNRALFSAFRDIVTNPDAAIAIAAYSKNMELFETMPSEGQQAILKLIADRPDPEKDDANAEQKEIT